MINEFRNEYYFLSNYYPCFVEIRYDGNNLPVLFKNAEAAFQASKAQSFSEFVSFASLDPATAKKKGRRINLRPDWEEIKDSIMTTIVYNKFLQNKELADKLLATGDEELIEENTWNDTYWGICNGVGKNQLGKTLMRAREYIKHCRLMKEEIEE